MTITGIPTLNEEMTSGRRTRTRGGGRTRGDKSGGGSRTRGRTRTRGSRN